MKHTIRDPVKIIMINVFSLVPALLRRSTRPAAYKVVLGIHAERGREASRQDRNVAKIVMGPNRADIALLKLES